jgi:type IV secretion system protein VirD4
VRPRRPRQRGVRRPGMCQKGDARKSKLPEAAALPAPPLALKPRPAPATAGRKPSSRGEAPQAPAGESYDIRDILASAAAAQNGDVEVMRGVLGAVAQSSAAVRDATEELASRHGSFGEDRGER